MNLRNCAGLALALAGLLPLDAKQAPEASRPAPEFNVDSTPVDRETTLRVSFAPVVKRAAECVVYISSTKKVKATDLNRLMQDPTMRRFFGPMVPDGQGEGEGRTQRQESLGSGVIIASNGYILTNNHVVEGADEVKVRTGESQKEYHAKVVARDSDSDVAVLKINATGLPAAVLGDSDQLQVGDTVLAIGDPFGVGMTVTHGIVSALGRNALNIERYEDFIQTDAPINPGNSGGALLDTKGRVVGINTAILTHTGGSNGVGFAIPINLVRSIAGQLIRTGKVSRGFLGVALQEMNSDLTDQFGGTTGALVADVTPGMPADKAGIQSGDIITKLNSKPIQDYRQLTLAISQLAPGSVVQLDFVRSGKVLHATATLGDRLKDSKTPTDSGATGGDTGVLNGVGVQDISADMREELHLPASVHGAIITEVAPDSASAQAGLQKGDIILDLNQQPVHNAQEAIRLSAEIKGPKVLVHFRRGAATQYQVVNEALAPSASGSAGPSADRDGEQGK